MNLKSLIVGFIGGVALTVLGLVIANTLSTTALVASPSDVSLLQAKAARILEQVPWDVHCDNSDGGLVVEQDPPGILIEKVREHLRSDGWKDSGDRHPDSWSKANVDAVFEASGQAVQNFRLYLRGSGSC